MARRSKDWNEGLAEDLKNPEFAKEFILASLEEGISIQVALGKVIRAYGVKEFSTKIKIPSPNIIRVINPAHNPTTKMLDKLLKPFNLTLAVKPIKNVRRKTAA